MAFNTVGIQDNLPVLPVHVLQIIESLTFSGTYAAESIYRQGRTNFGANAFTSSAHVEMHNYNGTDPLAVYSGAGGSSLVFKVDTAGGTTASALTASGASVTTASLGRTTIDNAIIATETVGTSIITGATITGAIVSNAVIVTLNGTVGAIATFTASNASVTNNLTASNILASTLRSPSANLTGSLLGSATSASYALSASYAVSASQADNALTASFVTGSNVSGPHGSNSVLSASYAVTASYALNTAASTPGGGNLSVQLNNANASFTGSQNLVWDTANTFLVNKGYYVIDYATNSGGGLLARSGTPATNSFQIAFNNQARYGGTINQFSGRQLTFYDFQAGGVTAYRAGMNEAGDFFIGNSNTDYSAKFQQPTQSTNTPLTLKAASGQTADVFKVTNNSDVAVLYVSASGLTSGSFKGNLDGTASFAPILAGPGITVNGMQVTASVRTVNGISPTNGNIAVSLAGVLTGLSSSNYNINLIASSSGNITSSFSDGALWVVSAETGSATSGSNGQVFIYKSGSVGQWLRVAPLDTAAADARYLLLAGGTMGGAINMGGFNATNAGTWQGTAYTASFVTASNVYGPYGVSSVVSSSYAVSSSFAVSSSYALSSSFATSASYALSSSFAVSASWAPVQTVSTASFITSGSISTTQAITGSLGVTGSLRVTGSLTLDTNTDPSRPYRIGASAANLRNVYPIPLEAYRDTNWNNVAYNGGNYTLQQAMFPAFKPYFGTTSNSTGGGNTISNAIGHLGIGIYTTDIISSDSKLEAVFLHSTQTASPNASTDTIAQGVVRTIVSDNNTVGTTGTLNTIVSNVYTANGRAHVFSVTGSMLARDGVSLGTNIANSHIITGSVNMTGSFTLNGTNLSTLVSPVQSVTVDLTQNQILNLGTTPINLVPPPGIDKYIAVVQIALYYNYVTSAYTGGTTVRIQSGETLLNSLDLLASTDDRIAITPGSLSTSIGSNGSYGYPANGLLNNPVRIITTDSAGNSQNPSGGFGTMRVRVLYTIEDQLV